MTIDPIIAITAAIGMALDDAEWVAEPNAQPGDVVLTMSQAVAIRDALAAKPVRPPLRITSWGSSGPYPDGWTFDIRSWLVGHRRGDETTVMNCSTGLAAWADSGVSPAIAAAFRRGAEAMREAAAQVASAEGWGNASRDGWSERHEAACDAADRIEAAIRALPIPEDTP